MYRRTNNWVYIVIILIAIGLFGRLASNPLGILLPLILFAIIFFLFKYPPKWLIRLAHQSPKTATHNQTTPKKRRTTTIKNNKKQDTQRKRRKNVKLRVIEGKKKDWPPRRKTP